MSPLLLAALVMRETSDPPTLTREFRGVWIATVANIDWPSRPGLPVAEAKAEMRSTLAALSRAGCNAVVLQVRPMADALYRSRLEPWSSFVSGRQGKSPGFDPLAFAVTTAHAEGMELHAWVNPFRARHATFEGPADPTHVTRRHPGWVVEYGNQAWVDPNAPGAQAHALAVVEDIVRRYDVDGLHIDDYFYPYPVRRADGTKLPFPDERSWAKRAPGTTDRDAWRRAACDRFVRDLYRRVKAVKPWVKVGVSPFGIARPGVPEGVTAGIDQYADLHADPVKWLREGWLDYLSPQLYWRRSAPQQPYDQLLEWWLAQERPSRVRVWPGLFTSQVGPQGADWPASEIVAQVESAQREAGGSVHFSAKALVGDWDGVAKALAEGPYRDPALVPTFVASGAAPPPPRVGQASGRAWRLELAPGGTAPVRFYVVAPEGPGRPIVTTRTTVAVPKGWTRVRVAAVDRAGRIGRARVVHRPGSGS